MTSTGFEVRDVAPFGFVLLGQEGRGPTLGQQQGKNGPSPGPEEWLGRATS